MDIIYYRTSNNTITSSDPFADASLIVIILYFIDFAMRICFLLTHVAYFIVVILFKSLQKLSYFPLHHINICGLFQGVLYTSWLGSVTPGFSDPYLNEVVCLISEFCSSVFKYSRSYSILVLAIYRLYGAYKPMAYKAFAKDKKFMISSTLFCWIFPSIVFFINKNLTGSVPGYFCSDGLYSHLYF